METRNPFVQRIIDQIIWGNPSSEELQRSLDKELAELETHEDKAKLLYEIYQMFTDRSMNVYKLGSNNIMDFLSYVEYQIKKENSNKEAKWSGLYDDLIKGGYIQKCVSLKNFAFVMENHSLPKESARITWTGARYNGYAFSKYFGFPNIPDFNKCFVPANGKDFRGNDKAPIMNEFEKILTKHNKLIRAR